MSEFDKLYKNPTSFIVKLTIPLCIVLFIEMLTSVVDTISAGYFGSEAIVALGLGFTVYNIIVRMGRGIGTGANALISYEIGKDNIEAANNVFYHSLFLSLVFSLIVTVILSVMLTPICQTMSYRHSELMVQYLFVIVIGVCVLFIVALFQEILKAQGDTRRPSIILTASLIVNVFLNLFFIFVVRLSLEGLALATLIANIFALVCLIFLIQRRDLNLTYTFSSYKRDFRIYKDLLNLAFPQYVDTIAYDGMEILIIHYLAQISGFVAAAYSISYKIESIITLPQNATGRALVSVTGFLSGRKDYDFIRRICKKSIIYVTILTIFLCILLYIFQNQVIHIFISNHDEIISIIKWSLIFISFKAIFKVTDYIISKVFIGFGKSIYSLALTLFKIFMQFIGMIFIFLYHLSTEYVLSLIVITQGLIIFAYLIVLHRYINKLEKYGDDRDKIDSPTK